MEAKIASPSCCVFIKGPRVPLFGVMNPTLGLRVTRSLLCILRLSLPQCHRWEGEHGEAHSVPKASGIWKCHMPLLPTIFFGQSKTDSLLEFN